MVAFDARVVVLSLRVAQAVLALIILSVTAYGKSSHIQWSRASSLTAVSQSRTGGTTIGIKLRQAKSTSSFSMQYGHSSHWHISSLCRGDFLKRERITSTAYFSRKP